MPWQKQGPTAMSELGSGAHDSPADLGRAQKVVKGVLKLKAAAPFSRPVNEEEVPGYTLAVQNPMDLGTVLDKLKNGEYTSLGEISFCAIATTADNSQARNQALATCSALCCFQSQQSGCAGNHSPQMN